MELLGFVATRDSQHTDLPTRGNVDRIAIKMEKPLRRAREDDKKDGKTDWGKILAIHDKVIYLICKMHLQSDDNNLIF